jgi:L-ascorbate metabolism protein UlaG (beta-lactamase superfamily)
MTKHYQNQPGEYEIGGVFIRGFATNTEYGGEKRINTIYTVSLEGMNICFLGALNDKTLPKSADEFIDNVDILFVPIGNQKILEAEDAYKLAVSMESKIIIPIHYGDIGQKDALKDFLKEAGESPEPVVKLTLKKKDLEGKDGDVVILASE